MNPSSLGQVAQDSAGLLAGGADPRTPALGVAIDSRAVRPGDVFVAIKGERVDGHDFARAALDAGAAAVLASREVDGPAILVDDPVEGLRRWASAHRGRLATGCAVVGVTGSSGKTSTKDLLGAVLSEFGPTVAPPGSLNTDIGLPLTLLAADETTRQVVLEMGSRHVGDVARLCEVGRPHIGVVLNVGSAHVGEFGSREAIAVAKRELVEAASELAVLNADDPLVLAMRPYAQGAVTTFGLSPDADVRAESVSLGPDGRAEFVLAWQGQRETVRLLLVGGHQVHNALAVAAVALHLGHPLGAVAQALGRAEPASRWRMEVHQRPDGVTVINDAYNANPESMRAALEALVAIGAGRRRTWAVLGPMAELGEVSAAEHLALGELVARLGVTRLVVVGEAASGLHAGAVRVGSWEGRSVQVADVDSALGLLEDELAAGDVLLVKASRVAGLERLALSIAGASS